MSIFPFQKGEIKREVCLQFNLAPSTLSKNEQKLWNDYERNSYSTRLHIRSSRYEDLEQTLVRWIAMVQVNNFVISTGSPIKRIHESKRIEISWISYLWDIANINQKSSHLQMLVKKTFIWMTLYEKKILQIPTANFANSEINSQVPPVSLKAELTVSCMKIRSN